MENAKSNKKRRRGAANVLFAPLMDARIYYHVFTVTFTVDKKTLPYFNYTISQDFLGFSKIFQDFLGHTYNQSSQTKILEIYSISQKIIGNTKNPRKSQDFQDFLYFLGFSRICQKFLGFQFGYFNCIFMVKGFREKQEKEKSFRTPGR